MTLRPACRAGMTGRQLAAALTPGPEPCSSSTGGRLPAVSRASPVSIAAVSIAAVSITAVSITAVPGPATRTRRISVTGVPELRLGGDPADRAEPHVDRPRLVRVEGPRAPG